MHHVAMALTHGQLRILPMAVFIALMSDLSAEELRWRFKVYLDDAEVGYYTLQLTKQEHRVRVDSAAQFNVKWLFFNAYRYTHQSQEVYQGNCLTGIHSTTNDNGDTYTVRGEADNRQFVVVTQNDQYTLPSCPMTFAYWNPAMLDKDRLLNAQTGQYTDVNIGKTGTELVQIAHQKVTADRYKLITKGKQIVLWYTKDGLWIGLESQLENDRKLRYQLESGPNSLPL